jgi:uncharacterized protein YfaS (alpha-2-macroglobulin family)
MLAAGCSLATLAALALGAGVAPPATAPATRPAGPATTAELGGAERYLSCLSTDKPIYRANEKVFARAVLLNAATRQPMGGKEAGRSVDAVVEIRGPKGEIVGSATTRVEESVAGFTWTVPPTASGGEYTLKVSYPWAGYAPAERKFDVRIYRAPRLRSQIAFVREGYGPGDKVTATLHTERAEGGFPAGAKVTVTARVDDGQAFAGEGVVDAKGDCTTSFELPKEIERGEGTLSFAIADGGTSETASKTIPILLQTLDLEMYAESGTPVVGHANRFYVEAKTPAKKPADLVGEIEDSSGKKVAEVRTEHEGRGRFELVPLAGEHYTLKVSQPAGIRTTWKLPAAQEHGVILRSTTDIVGRGQPVKLRLMAVEPGTYRVTLKRHEVEVADAVSVRVSGNQANDFWDVAFEPKEGAEGVLTATVWDEKGMPLAERLIYRQPAHGVHVAVTADQSTYTPGGRVKLDIRTTDDAGKPVSAVVGLTVTDDSVLEMVEKREQAPRLPAMALLEPEVRELADARVYLDEKNPKSALATDLLLGTQGWRRFALMKAEEFESKYGDDARRVLAVVKPNPPVPAAMPMGGGFGGGGRGGRGGRLRFADNAAVEGNVAVDAVQLGIEAGEAKHLLAKEEAAEPGRDREAVLEAPQQKIQANAAAFAPQADADRRVVGFARRIGPGSMVVVREYAHELRPGWTPSDRSDFTETVYWNAGLKTDDTGHATASFALSDAVTTLRVQADSFDQRGALGSADATVQAVQPFYIEPKMPLEVTTGDQIDLPVTVVNNTAGALEKLAMHLKSPDGWEVEPQGAALTTVAGGQRARQMYRISVKDPVEGDLTIDATSGSGERAFADRVTRKLRVRPTGFPTQLAFGGLLDKDSPAKKEFEVPVSVVPHSMQTAITVYSSPVANLTDAVAALMREPCGCFEQTSSSNYPLAMAQQYFVNHRGVDPKLIAHASDLLNKGYQRLIGFECKEKGYEWFGTGPGHEALTAYGLMEFHDMQAAKVAIVDPQMVDRTRGWLLARRDGKGGFERNARALDSFGGAPQLTTDAYIVWALLQAGETPASLEKEIAAVRSAAATSTDSYVLALAANILQKAGGENAPAGASLLEKLAHKQGQTGSVEGATTSITRSGGEALAIETTSLAALAWMGDPHYAGEVQRAIQFLADSCKGGRFGSTQSTILALRAITTYDQAMAHPKADGQVVLLLDGAPRGAPIKFTADSKEPLKFGDISDALKPGLHTVALQMEDGSQMPFSIAVNFNSTTPASDPQCKLRLETWLKDAQLPEGGITEARVVVTNKSDKDAATPVAIVGVPGGLEVRHDQLKELVKEGKIDAYEVNGREVVLYWRQIKAGAKADLSLSLTAAVPGTYTAPASRAYEYYTDEFKQWVEGATVKIAPR